ncbi:hypothetical protein EYF80_055228 [Liparis tanakae]|uniref:Uncharacterized protein n=1 Tax=Liparis tanakae TaxID=230148 RepID=A0A4Z2F0Q2_9TELE|nr:hypothetical protein EYF80_055228 [Liparis tanakae]
MCPLQAASQREITDVCRSTCSPHAEFCTRPERPTPPRSSHLLNPLSSTSPHLYFLPLQSPDCTALVRSSAERAGTSH